ncbi:efflux RND transporter periplasmic adaptor subunit [Rickettsiales bacterium]|nr:efflux RND transporter periplasmic adaptor subunit [Rickettsiales bacterium]
MPQYNDKSNEIDKGQGGSFSKKILILAVIIVISVMFISLTKSESVETNIDAVNSTPIVDIVDSYAKEITQDVIMFGEIEAVRKVDIFAQTSAKVETIHKIEGQKIYKGELIAELDLQRREYRLSEAKAVLKQRKLEYEVAKSLAKMGHQSDTKLAAALSALKEAEAKNQEINQEIERTKIIAPFDGVLNKLYIEEGSLVSANTTMIATIFDESSFIATGDVAEGYMGYMKEGNIAYVRLLSGQKMPAAIKYVGRAADENTRTFKLEVDIDNSDEINIAHGMTAEIKIPFRRVKAHFISPSVFSLNQAGDIGVKILEDQNKVRFKPIDIIKEDGDGMWVSGLPDSIRLITLGQAFLKDGDTALTKGDR